MENQTRPVDYSAIYVGDDVKYIDISEGTFHRWADETYFEDDFRQRVVALVEASDGQMFRVVADRIRFLERQVVAERQRKRLLEQYKDK